MLAGGSPLAVAARGGEGPIWWTPGAVFDADIANSRFYWNRRSYNDETNFLAAVNGSKAGIVRTIGPYVDPTGTNLFTNGTFTGNVTGWTAFNTGASVASVSNELELTTTTDALGGFLQGVAGVAGRAFRLTGTGRKGAGAANLAIVGANSSAGASVFGTNGLFNSSSNLTTSGYIGASVDPHYFGVRSTNFANGVSYYDNFILEECWPFLGFTQNAYSVVIDAVAASSHAATQTLWSADVGASDTVRVALDRNTSGNIIISVRTQAAVTVSLDLGNVADSAAFSVSASFAPNNVTGALNGVAATPDTSATLPGAAFMRIGNNVAGTQTWGGSINRVTVL